LAAVTYRVVVRVSVGRALGAEFVDRLVAETSTVTDSPVRVLTARSEDRTELIVTSHGETMAQAIRLQADIAQCVRQCLHGSGLEAALTIKASAFWPAGGLDSSADPGPGDACA
jgi:hypothetical protein